MILLMIKLYTSSRKVALFFCAPPSPPEAARPWHGASQIKWGSLGEINHCVRRTGFTNIQMEDIPSGAMENHHLFMGKSWQIMASHCTSSINGPISIAMLVITRGHMFEKQTSDLHQPKSGLNQTVPQTVPGTTGTTHRTTVPATVVLNRTKFLTLLLQVFLCSQTMGL